MFQSSCQQPATSCSTNAFIFGPTGLDVKDFVIVCSHTGPGLLDVLHITLERSRICSTQGGGKLAMYTTTMRVNVKTSIEHKAKRNLLRSGREDVVCLFVPKWLLAFCPAGITRDMSQHSSHYAHIWCLGSSCMTGLSDFLLQDCVTKFSVSLFIHRLALWLTQPSALAEERL